MRKCYLVVTTVLLTLVWVAAESAGQQTTHPNLVSPSGRQPDPLDGAQKQPAQPSAEDTRDSLLEGCLGGSNGSFTLTDAAGKIYRLRGHTAMLTDHVGQQISIVGTEDPGSDVAGQPSFLLKKVTIIGRACSPSK